MSTASDARYGRITGRRWVEFVAWVLEVKGTRCSLCGGAGATSVDHPIPLSKGGHPMVMDNAEPAHLSCNKARGNRSLEEWFAAHPLTDRPAAAPSRDWFTP